RRNERAPLQAAIVHLLPPTSYFLPPTLHLREEFRPMLSLAAPVVIAELGWITMGMVDTLMVGRLSAEAIGAVGLGSALFIAVGIFGMGMMLGLDTLVSQAFGAGRLDE